MNAPGKNDVIRRALAAGLALVLLACASGPGSWRTRAAIRPGAAFGEEDARDDAMQTSAASPTLLVTSTADTDDGLCNAANCTLREAIKVANTQAGDDVIGFAATVAGTITLLTARLRDDAAHVTVSQ
jgi:CSLREA domain-containing protein